MKGIKPPKLSLGDTVGVITPSSPPTDPHRIDDACEALEDLGFRVKRGKHLRKRRGYLAGTDSERLADLHDMFVDKSVKAIIALRGGYGASRLLSHIRYDLVRKNPKIFCGFSDITALHLAFWSQCGLVSFHGPHAASSFAPETADTSRTISSFFRVTFATKAHDLGEGFSRGKIKTIAGGVAEGRLLGGNLSLVCSLLGTRYAPSFRGAIIFLEDVGEAPYRIDRYLTQLKNAGVLSVVHGVVLGTWSNCYGEKRGSEREFLKLLESFFRPLRVPVLYGFPFGHVDDYCTLPHGARVRLDGDRRTLHLLETPVKN